MQYICIIQSGIHGVIYLPSNMLGCNSRALNQYISLHNRKSRCGVKTWLRSSHLPNGNSYSDKTTSLSLVGGFLTQITFYKNGFEMEIDISIAGCGGLLISLDENYLLTCTKWFRVLLARIPKLKEYWHWIWNHNQCITARPKCWHFVNGLF